jgi:hypothetical protein
MVLREAGGAGRGRWCWGRQVVLGVAGGAGGGRWCWGRQVVLEEAGISGRGGSCGRWGSPKGARGSWGVLREAEASGENNSYYDRRMSNTVELR